MLSDNQSQSAGDNANQFQAQTINVYNTTEVLGITEERAKEIIDEKIQAVIQNYSTEAHETAYKRIKEFSTVLVPKLVREQLLDSLRDPSVQILLMDAEKSATASGKENDYELLSELLIHRVKKGNNRSIVAGVNHAVKIVDEISDEALQGLTVAHSIESFIPVCDGIEDGLRALSVLFDNIIYDDLPKGREWEEHLDILNAIRINPFGELKKIEQFYSEQLSGYVDIGIKKTSDNYNKAVNILKNVQLPLDVLMDHELRHDYVRLKLLNRSRMDLLCLQATEKMNMNGLLVEVPVKQKLSKTQNEALGQVYDLYEDNEKLRNENNAKFMEMFNSFDALRKVGEWWNNIDGSFSITSVGRVLAHANAQKCDPNLPPLD